MHIAVAATDIYILHHHGLFDISSRISEMMMKTSAFFMLLMIFHRDDWPKASSAVDFKSASQLAADRNHILALDRTMASSCGVSWLAASARRMTALTGHHLALLARCFIQLLSVS